MHAEIDSLRTALATMHNEIAGRRTEVDQQAQKLLAAGDGFSQQMSQTTGHLSGETDRLLKVAEALDQSADRKSVGEGKSVSVRVDLGGRRIIQKKKHRKTK